MLSRIVAVCRASTHDERCKQRSRTLWGTERKVGMAVSRYEIYWRGLLFIGYPIPVRRDNVGADSLVLPNSYIF